jgi:hypothetical protein
VLSNLDGSEDGSLEIIAGAFDRHLYAWHANGVPVPGWPVLLKDPAKVESVDPETNEVTLKGDANADIGTKIIAPPSVGDLDGDGREEVVAVVNEEYREPPNTKFTNSNIQLFIAFGAVEPGNTRVYAVHRDGVAHGGSGMTRGWNPAAFVPGWPVRTALLTTGLLPLVGTGSNGPPALADVDNDGRLEIATFSAIGPAYVFTADGEPFLGEHESGEAITFATDTLGAGSNSTDAPSFSALGAPVLAEFAGVPGSFQLLTPGAGLGKFLDNQLAARQFPADNHVLVWDVTQPDGTRASGAMRDAFPRVVNDLQFFGGPAVADISGDGRPEAIAGSGVYDLHAIDIDGEEPAGWPKFTNGWMTGSPAVGDIDGDGLLEVVATIREGRLLAWRTSGSECGNVPWRRYHHDEWGTGNYGADTRPPATLSQADVRMITALAPDVLRISLARVPGDDGFCGMVPAQIRFASEPILDDAAFMESPVATGRAVVMTGMRDGESSSFDVRDAHFAGQTWHFAMVATDEAGNRSPLLPLGSASFPSVPTSTPTLVPDPTVTRTVPFVSPTSTRTFGGPPSPARDDDDGCTLTPSATASGWPLLLPLLIAAAKRRCARRHRREGRPRTVHRERPATRAAGS